MLAVFGLPLLFAVIAPAAYGQVDLGTGVGPETFGFGEERPKKEVRPPILPLALATSLAFDSTTWAEIKASTAPAQDLTALLAKGFYKLELYQILILAKRSGTALRDLAAEREKGERLRAMAARLKLDYDEVYGQSLELDREVEGRLLPSVMTISVSTAAPAGSAPPRRRARRH